MLSFLKSYSAIAAFNLPEFLRKLAMSWGPFFFFGSVKKRNLYSVLIAFLAPILIVLFQNCSGQFSLNKLSNDSDYSGLNQSTDDADIPIDPDAPLSIYARNLEVHQGNNFEVTFQLNKVHTESISLILETQSDSALANVDFVPTANVTGSLIIPAGETSARFTVESVVPHYSTEDSRFFLSIKSSSTGIVAQQRSRILILARFQQATGFKSLFDLEDRLCSIDSQGVLSCLGCIPKPLGVAESFPGCDITSALKIVPNLPPIKDLTSRCFLTKDERVLCSGSTQGGRAGVDPLLTAYVETPTEITSLRGLVTSIKSTASATCGLLKSGNVKCWGSGQLGDLGNGSLTDSYRPVDVIGIANVKTLVSKSNNQFCVLQINGQIFCWGNLEAPFNAVISAPAPIYQAGGIRSITAGASGNLCILQNSGSVGCLELGSDRFTFNLVIKQELTGIDKIVGGNAHACALSLDKRISCWGSNNFGMLGYTLSHDSYEMTPKEIAEWQGALAVSASSYRTCALMPDTTVRCAGYDSGIAKDLARTFGILNLNINIYNKPNASESVLTGRGFNFNGHCVTTQSGAVKCWDTATTADDYTNPSNLFSRQGNEIATQWIDVPAKNIDNLLFSSYLDNQRTRMSSGCYIDSDSTVKCWGSNSSGQLGNGSNTDSVEPAAVIGLTGVIKIGENGTGSRCALTNQKKLFCWGYNSYQIFGSMVDRTASIPVEITSVSKVVDFSLDSSKITVLLADGTAKKWGFLNESTQTVPMDLGLTGIAKFYPQADCMLLKTGSVMCRKNPLSELIYELVPGLTDVSDITLLNSATCAVLNSGSVKCWGTNQYGDVGTGNQLSTLNPIVVNGVSGAKKVFMDQRGSACAYTVEPNSSHILCWGNTWQNENPTLNTYSIDSLKNSTPLFDNTNHSGTYLTASGRIKTFDSIRISAGPFNLLTIK